eukprot:CFRG2632T1
MVWWAVFENERWLPVQGWGSTLPTERNSWSNECGSVSVPSKPAFMSRHRFHPNASDGRDWSVDVGGITDINGWTYAKNFTDLKTISAYGNSDPSHCLVRRRRWVCETESAVPLDVLVKMIPDADSIHIKLMEHSAAKDEVEYISFEGKNMVQGMIKDMKADGYAGTAQTLREARECALLYNSQHCEQSKSYYFTWHTPQLRGSWAGRVYVWDMERTVASGREDPSVWPDQKHIISVVATRME